AARNGDGNGSQEECAFIEGSSAIASVTCVFLVADPGAIFAFCFRAKIASEPLRSLVDHSASAPHCNKTRASPHRSFWRFFRSDSKWSSCVSTGRRPPLQF